MSEAAKDTDTTETLTAAELVEQNRAAAIARGDIIEDQETDDEQGEQDIMVDDLDDDDDDAAATDQHDDEAEVADTQAAKKNLQIPKARFDEVNKKAKDLEVELAALRAQVAADSTTTTTTAEGEAPPAPQAEAGPTVTDLRTEMTTKRKALRDAEEDFDDDKVSTLSKEIADLEDAIIDARVQASVAAQVKRQAEQSVKAKASEIQTALLETYPALADDTAEFFAFVGFRDKFIKSGKSLPEALILAEAEVFGDAKKTTAQDGDEADDEEDGELSQRQLQARLRNAKAQNQQPPRKVGGMGSKEFQKTINPAKLSEEEFDKLPAEEKRKMRGDFVGGKVK